MRELFDDIANNSPFDPVEAVRRGARPQLRKRFYGKADIAKGESGFAILLDAYTVKTPARRVLQAPTRVLAEAIAGEWAAQGELIDPLNMPLTRLAASIIDGVVDAPAAVAAEVAKYLATDMVLYRAESPDGLVARQARNWDPVLDWAHEALGADFVPIRGVVFVPQPEAAIAAAAVAIPRDPWRLGALSAITTLTGSALVALALLGGRLSVEAAWTAAHVDEDWNMEQWGRDDLALERRAFRHAEFLAVAAVLSECGPT
jgi:chaperone required for assembly of F1-ATPase